MIAFQQYPYANEFGCKITRYWGVTGFIYFDANSNGNRRKNSA